ncbi:MAG: hypothetical protein GF400_03515 [Candidatus Eisenbacteria bacterium]|nr:hypothetical protein [Candidatus Eisenbacteria bacterium]
MQKHRIGRDEVVSALRRAVEPLEFALAMWEGGAAAFDRVDEWSDLDLQVLCEDGRVEDVLAAARDALEALGPLDVELRFPEPTWHGHSQVLWRLRDASPFLIVDFVVMEKGTERDRLLQPEVHGRARVHFARGDHLTVPPLDARAHAAMLRGRVARYRGISRLWQSFVRKEIERGNAVEAVSYYQSMVLRGLVELLRIRHSPLRHNFHTRYVHYELPADVSEKLETLFYVADAEEVGGKCDEAVAWADDLLDELGDGPDESTIAEAIRAEIRGSGS